MSEFDDIVAGAWDIHVHADPSLFPRRGTALELVEACRAASMAGVVLKAHHGSTVELADQLDSRAGGLRVVGGVVLNEFVGGLNPFAVESAVELGAAIVWLPTLHAAAHARACGRLGGFDFQTGAVDRAPETGLTLTDDSGALRPEVLEIVDILDGRETVLATGHVSADEIRALHEHLRETTREVDLLVNHAFFQTPNLDRETIAELADERTFFEITHISVSPTVEATSAHAVATAIDDNPDANWIVATDSGQTDNPPAPEALARFVRILQDAGLRESTLHEMSHATPARLLGALDA